MGGLNPLPLSYALREAEKDDNKSLERTGLVKCISCDYKEEWYSLLTCTFNGAGIPGQHSSYTSVSVIKNYPSKMNKCKIKLSKSVVFDYLKNFNASNIDKSIRKLEYLKSVTCNDYFLLPKSYTGNICDDCVKKPDYNRIKNNIKILKFLNIDSFGINVVSVNI